MTIPVHIRAKYSGGPILRAALARGVATSISPMMLNVPAMKEAQAAIPRAGRKHRRNLLFVELNFMIVSVGTRKQKLKSVSQLEEVSLGGICLSVQFCSHIWSKLLTAVYEEENYWVGTVEITEGWHKPGVVCRSAILGSKRHCGDSHFG